MLLASCGSVVSLLNKAQDAPPGEGTHKLLAAEGAHHLRLGRLHGRAVGVDWDAGSGSFGLLVLAVDAVFLGDRHFGGSGWRSFVELWVR